MLYVIAGRFKNELSLVSYQIYPFLWKIASELRFFPKFLSQFFFVQFFSPVQVFEDQQVERKLVKTVVIFAK